jgi:hypothetical protein
VSRLGGAALCCGRPSPVATQGAANGSCGTRSRGCGGNIVDLGSRRCRGWRCRRRWAKHPRVRAGRGRELQPIPKATGWMSRSFGFAASRTRRRGSAANAGVHGVAPPTGRAAGYARSERRWSTGFGPEIVGVSTGWAPLQTLADGAAHGAVVAAAESLGRAGATSRGHSCPLGRRTRARVPSERSAGPGGLRSNGAGRRRRAASWSTVPSRASGGNTASASILFVESVSHRICRGLIGRGVTAGVVPSAKVIGVAGVRPQRVGGRGARCVQVMRREPSWMATSATLNASTSSIRLYGTLVGIGSAYLCTPTQGHERAVVVRPFATTGPRLEHREDQRLAPQGHGGCTQPIRY